MEVTEFNRTQIEVKHRYMILNRESTNKEVEFLKQSGSGYRDFTLYGAWWSTILH